MTQLEIVTVVIEYSPTQRRVMVRGVFRDGQQMPPLLATENKQNRVRVLVGMDMGAAPGFVGLIPENAQ